MIEPRQLCYLQKVSCQVCIQLLQLLLLEGQKRVVGAIFVIKKWIAAVGLGYAKVAAQGRKLSHLVALGLHTDSF